MKRLTLILLMILCVMPVLGAKHARTYGHNQKKTENTETPKVAPKEEKCGDGVIYSFPIKEEEKSSTKKEQEKEKKVLVACYSWSGNTKYAAEVIEKVAKAEIFWIIPKESYPTDFKKCVERAKKEVANGFKPELKTKPENINQYDVIFLGSPNWCSTISPPVLSFTDYLKDFKGKVIPFITHGSGGLANCEKDIKKALPDVNVAPAGAWSGDSIKKSDEKIIEWVKTSLKN